jgi:hypothetical protein
MSALAAATNRVQPTPHSHVATYGGITVNSSIPIGAIEPWRTEAIQKVIGFANLPANWDARGSTAPALGVRQTAIDFLMRVPSVGAPRVVPISGGGYHFEWSVGNRELEISIEANCRIEGLRVEDGMPIEETPAMDLAAMFGWLISK